MINAFGKTQNWKILIIVDFSVEKPFDLGAEP